MGKKGVNNPTLYFQYFLLLNAFVFFLFQLWFEAWFESPGGCCQAGYGREKDASWRVTGSSWQKTKRPCLVQTIYSFPLPPTYRRYKLLHWKYFKGTEKNCSLRTQNNSAHRFSWGSMDKSRKSLCCIQLCFNRICRNIISPVYLQVCWQSKPWVCPKPKLKTNFIKPSISCHFWWLIRALPKLHLDSTTAGVLQNISYECDLGYKLNRTIYFQPVKV